MSVFPRHPALNYEVPEPEPDSVDAALWLAALFLLLILGALSFELAASIYGMLL